MDLISLTLNGYIFDNDNIPGNDTYFITTINDKWNQILPCGAVFKPVEYESITQSLPWYYSKITQKSGKHMPCC